MPAPHPTFAAIARRAKVSKMTVSRAMRGQPGVSTDVIERIKRIARAMNYRPNPLVQAHMTQVRTGRVRSSHAIGLLVPQLDDPHWGREEWIRLCLQGAQARAREKGFSIETFRWLRGQVSDTRMDQILKARGVRGLVIAPLARPGFDLHLDWNHYAAAAIGATLRQPRLHRARHHAFHSIQIAVARLRAAGCRRIGLAISATSDARVDNLWRAGFLLAASDEADPASSRPIHCPDVLERNAFLKWLRRDRPDGLVIPDHHCYQWLAEAGWRMPEDLAVASVNRYGPYPQLAGIDQRLEAMAAATVDLVIEQYYLGDFGIPASPKDVLLEGTWVDGPTVPAPRASGTRAKSRAGRVAS